MTARKSKKNKPVASASFQARDLPIGSVLQVSCGAFFPPRTVKVVEQKSKRNPVLGEILWTECVVVDGFESESPDLDPALYRDGALVRIEGSETLLGIGWKRTPAPVTGPVTA